MSTPPQRASPPRLNELFNWIFIFSATFIFSSTLLFFNIKKIKKERIKERKGFYKLPVVRGAVNLYDMLVMGMKAISWSADQQLGKKEKISKKEMSLSVMLAFALGIGLFMALPYFLTNFIG